jgi:hypothetical protein
LKTVCRGNFNNETCELFSLAKSFEEKRLLQIMLHFIQRKKKVESSFFGTSQKKLNTTPTRKDDS